MSAKEKVCFNRSSGKKVCMKRVRGLSGVDDMGDMEAIAALGGITAAKKKGCITKGNQLKKKCKGVLVVRRRKKYGKKAGSKSGKYCKAIRTETKIAKNGMRMCFKICKRRGEEIKKRIKCGDGKKSKPKQMDLDFSQQGVKQVEWQKRFGGLNGLRGRRR